MEWSIYVPSGLLFGLAIAFGYSVIPGKMNYFSGRLLKYPTIAIIYSIVLVELIFYSAIRLFIVFVETAIASPTHRRLRTLMEQQTSYGDWYKVASQLDHSKGLTRWQDDLNDFTALHFNWDFLRHLIADMKLARKNQDASMGLAVLHQCIRKNIGGIFREELYSYTNTGEPKNLVIEFVDEVVTTLEWLTERDPEVDVTSLLDSARIIYGRTALCLSGGGMMALYHLGSVRALLIEGILPHIISGASAGALCAAFVCTRRDEELIRDLNPDILHPKFTCCSRTWSQRIRSYIKTGAMFDNDEWFELVKWFTCGDLTFQEAYEKSKRVLCITLSTTTKKAPPTVINHISAPNVVITSAVIASSSMPGLLRPTRLRMKNPRTGKIEILQEEYWDGSIEQDIPISGLSEMLNCQFFVVAQANPHVVPFVFNSDGDVGKPNRWSHSRRGGYLLSGLELFLKMDMKTKLNFLHEVGAVVGFTAILMTQNFGGTSTIVPHVKPIDFIKAAEDPTLEDMYRYFQGGTVAAYRNFAMIKLHYNLARTMDECMAKLQKNKEAEMSIQEKMASTIPIVQNRSSQTYEFLASLWRGGVTDL